MGQRTGPRQPRTLADWTEALAASGWKGRKVGREHVGPCPVCGGEDRFHVAAGARVAVIASCRHGCTFADLAAHVFPRPLTARRGPRRPDWPRNRPKARRGPENGSQGGSGGFGGIRAGSGAVESPVRRSSDLPRGRGTPGFRPGMEDHAPPVNTARRLWGRSGPVPMDPAHPARRWAARRNLWPPDRTWPDAVRWIERDGGSLVAVFAPLGDWTEHPPASPSGVQLVHVDGEGQPRKDRGGLAKRSHGSMTGAVCVIGELAGSGTLHVVEGIADALAVAAREDGPAVATGGAGGFKRLAPDLAALSRPVLIHADGDPAGIVAARRLLADLTRRGIAGAVRTYPPGCDPAQPTTR